MRTHTGLAPCKQSDLSETIANLDIYPLEDDYLLGSACSETLNGKYDYRYQKIEGYNITEF